MLLELRQLFDNESEHIKLNCDVDLSAVELWGRTPFSSPVHVTGEIANRAGVVVLDYTATFTIEADCDRCLEHFIRAQQEKYSHVLVRALSGEDRDDFVVVPDARLELSDLVASDVILTLPVKLLCSEDCKGLCQRCGANLNQSQCSCPTTEIDPRLAALRQLLD